MYILHLALKIKKNIQFYCCDIMWLKTLTKIWPNFSVKITKIIITLRLILRSWKCIKSTAWLAYLLTYLALSTIYMFYTCFFLFFFWSVFFLHWIEIIYSLWIWLRTKPCLRRSDTSVIYCRTKAVVWNNGHRNLQKWGETPSLSERQFRT